MYHKRPNLTIGFHGCDQSVRNDLVLMPDKVKKSQENYDWLGHGFYVWENNFSRALTWAQDKASRSKLETPSVVGVIYQLDHCLDFTDSEFIDLLPIYYNLMKEELSVANKEIPFNKNSPNDRHKDLIVRALDCAVIEYLHQKIEEQIALDLGSKGYSRYNHFDTVRGIFTEGGPIFEGAGIQSKNHIQVCIRNLNCIKGFFVPRQLMRFP